MPANMLHLNGHILCAVDVETTGFIAGYHELVQIAVLPLDSEIEPREDVTPFYVNIAPECPERADPDAMKTSGLDLTQLQLTGLEASHAATLFVEWWESLRLALKKKIAPLASNWIFDSGFIKEWLGPSDFSERFHFHYRDTQAAALYMKDRAYAFGYEDPFSRIGVKELGNHYKIENLQAHDALQDCVTTAKIYKAMLMDHVATFPKAAT